MAGYNKIRLKRYSSITDNVGLLIIDIPYKKYSSITDNVNLLIKHIRII